MRHCAPVLGETQTALMTSEFTGESWYHSMQATLRKQLSKGLTFQAAYTFSKAENNMTVLNDQYNLALSKARASFDRTHRIIANFDYQLPLPAGTAKVQRALLQGWSLTGIVLVQSGLPMTLTDPNGGTVYAGRPRRSRQSGDYVRERRPAGRTARHRGSTHRLCDPAALATIGGYGNTKSASTDRQVNADLSSKRRRLAEFEGAELAFGQVL